ncbi:hypothetical protein [Lentzea sp. NBRC 105346]|uniref:hypothetical protein n=1 Tax=Lentzea sp. NBRC 105346 TaxID=3032205 RepID=UPI00255562A7|nr:hypothetical protein [Lentzea sp. NBRC 105346]
MRPTGVIPGGPAPTITSTDVTIYLVGPDGGLVRRTRVLTGETTAATPLQTLLAGPTDAERKEGLTSEVPVTTGAVIIRTGNTLILPIDTGTLPGVAHAQLGCTAMTTGLSVAGIKAFAACP